MSTPAGITLTIPPPKGGESILTHEALDFLAILHRTFNKKRKELLENRKKVQVELDKVRGVSLLQLLKGKKRASRLLSDLLRDHFTLTC